MQSYRSRTALVAVVVLASASAAALIVACATAGGPTGALNEDASTESGSNSSSGGGSGSGSGSSSGGGGGCDANTQSDWTNCGSCGHVCATGDICNGGQCQAPCAAPLSNCPGQSGCYNLTSDLQNCGVCGEQCLPPAGGSVVGTPACVNSVCTFTCPTDAGVPEGGGPIVQCGGDSGTAGCFDLTSSSEHCGSCGTVCGTGQVCTESNCCATGDSFCGGACINVQTDPKNCGACDAGCAAQCQGGKCIGYTQSNPTAAFVDACAATGSQTVLVNQQDWAMSAAITLPFAFTFFGTSETEVFAGTAGTMGFGAPSLFYSQQPDCSAPSPFTNYASVVAFGDSNLYTGTNGVCYATTGTAPNRQFVMTWKQATYANDPGSMLTFSIQLTETTNTIDLVYQTAAGADGGVDPNVAGAGASVLVQLPGPPELTAQASCNKAFIPSTPYDIRFTPAQ